MITFADKKKKNMNIYKPLLLISNDDGYHAKGLKCLIDTVRHLGEIIVVAPESARSGFSGAFSAMTPLRLKLRHQEEGVSVYSCNGTPVDCVKLGLSEICARKPDMIIGGINHGDNASVNTHYSGTMGVTMEGCMKYIPSVAFSLCDHDDDANFEPMKKIVSSISERVLSEGLPKGVCLNVNFPAIEKYQGVKVCRMAHGTWGKEVVRNHHPRGFDYFWLVGEYTNDEPEATDTDNWALTHGYVAITPTTIDVTDYKMIDKMKNWTFD
jgi:5'-nucleotidase